MLTNIAVAKALLTTRVHETGSLLQEKELTWNLAALCDVGGVVVSRNSLVVTIMPVTNKIRAIRTQSYIM